MPNELPLPEDLQHLIEKRESGGRRQTNRRNASDENESNDQRSGTDRRQSIRRAGDERFRPGDQPGTSGRYRCEACLRCIEVRKSKDRLPPCSGCGNRTDSLYALVPE